jgi:Mce-associated membrane protein
MSSQNPSPRSRRRIAGERKSARPATGTATRRDVAEEVPVEPEQPSRPTIAPAAPPERAAAPGTPESRAAEPESEPDSAPDSAPESGEAAGGPARPVPWPVMVALGLVAVVLLALAAGPFVDGMGWQDYRTVQAQADLDQARRQAPAAAERAAEAILSYDYKTLEADRDAAAALMTPRYRKQYLDTFDSLVTDAAKERKAHVEANVRASGVSQAGADRVEVLLFVNQTTTSTANSGEPQTALNRVMFSMVRTGGAWRVDDITSY